MTNEEHDAKRHRGSREGETEEKPKTVTVLAVVWHTYDNHEYNPGDTYEIPEVYASSVEAQAKAFRIKPQEPPPPVARR